MDETFQPFELYEIQPLKREDVIEYLTGFKDKFESGDEASRFYGSLPDLIKEFVSIPVFLYIMVCTYDKEKPVEITNPGELLRNYEDFLCGSRGAWRESWSEVLDEDYRKRIIPFIGFNMCLNHEKMVTWNRFNEYIREFEKKTSSSISERDVKDAVTKRFRLMKTDENQGFEFIHQTLRDYFAAVYLINNDLSPDEIFKLLYTDSTRNNDLVNAIKLLSGIVKPEIAKNIISKFIEKDLYLTCEMFAWSSITEFDEEFLNRIRKKINITSREYLLNLSVAVSFFLKILDLLNAAKREDESVYADYLQNLGIAYSDKLDHDRAIGAYQKAIEIYEKNNMQNHPYHALCHVNLGNAYRDTGKRADAIQCFELALGIFEESVGKNHPYYKKCMENLSKAKEAKKL